MYILKCQFIIYHDKIRIFENFFNILDNLLKNLCKTYFVDKNYF